MSRLRLSYKSKHPTITLDNSESRAILVKISIPSEGITKTVLINTTSLISDLRNKINLKLKTKSGLDGYAFFWYKDNDQLWLDDKVSLKAYNFKDGELVEFKQKPKNWKPVPQAKNVGPWVKGAPKAQANYVHQLDKSAPNQIDATAPATSANNNNNSMFAKNEQTFNQLYVDESEGDNLATESDAKEPAFETFDDILQSLSKSSEEIISRKSLNANKRTSLVARKNSNAEALKQNSYFKVNDTGTPQEDYARRLKEVNDVLWKIVNGIDSGSMDAKTIRRLAKKGLQHCTIVNAD